MVIKQITFSPTGGTNRVEIWDKQKWQDSNTYDDMDEVAEHMAELGLGI